MRIFQFRTARNQLISTVGFACEAQYPAKQTVPLRRGRNEVVTRRPQGTQCKPIVNRTISRNDASCGPGDLPGDSEYDRALDPKNGQDR